MNKLPKLYSVFQWFNYETRVRNCESMYMYICIYWKTKHFPSFSEIEKEIIIMYNTCQWLFFLKIFDCFFYLNKLHRSDFPHPLFTLYLPWIATKLYNGWGFFFWGGGGIFFFTFFLHHFFYLVCIRSN